MVSSVVVKLVWLVAIVCVALSGLSREAHGAVTCGQVVNNLSPCVSYLANGGSTVPAECCNGIRNLYGLAQTKQDRQAVCSCIKSAVNGFGPVSSNTLNLAAGLPKKCGVNIPYQISPNIDCTKVN